MNDFRKMRWLLIILAVLAVTTSNKLMAADSFKFTCFTKYFLNDTTFSVSGEIDESSSAKNLYSYFNDGFYFSAKSTVLDSKYKPKSSKYKDYNLFGIDLWNKSNALVLDNILGGDSLMLPKDLQASAGKFIAFYRQQDGQGGSYNKMLCQTGTMMAKTSLEQYLYRSKYKNTGDLTRKILDDVVEISNSKLIDSMNLVAIEAFSNWFKESRMKLLDSAAPYVLADWIDADGTVNAKEVISKNTYSSNESSYPVFSCHHFLVSLDGGDFTMIPGEDCHISFVYTK